jgi:lysozyme
MFRILDVSAVQAVVDWPAVKAAGYSGAYVKAYEGNKGPDYYFHANVAGCRAAGLLVGSYDFLYPLPHLDPAEQAQKHHLFAGLLDLLPAADLEWPPQSTPKRPGLGQEWSYWGCTAQSIREWAKAYLAKRSELLGYKPIVYTYPDYATNQLQLGTDPDFAAYPLWIASYPASYQHFVPLDGASPQVVKPWASWALWQHSGGGLALPGSGVPVDGNVCRDLADISPPAQPYTTPIALPDVPLT